MLHKLEHMQHETFTQKEKDLTLDHLLKLNSYVAVEQQPSPLVALSQSFVFPEVQHWPGAAATSAQQKKLLPC